MQQTGGVFSISNSNFIMMSETSNDDGTVNVIQNNVAGDNGGFISAFDNSIMNIQEYNFINNKAQYGGVFFIRKSKLILLVNENYNNNNDYNLINNNVATLYGGCIAADQSSNIMIQDYNIMNNIASRGGAIYLHTSILTIDNYNIKITTISNL